MSDLALCVPALLLFVVAAAVARLVVVRRRARARDARSRALAAAVRRGVELGRADRR